MLELLQTENGRTAVATLVAAVFIIALVLYRRSRLSELCISTKVRSNVLDEHKDLSDLLGSIFYDFGHGLADIFFFILGTVVAVSLLRVLHKEAFVDSLKPGLASLLFSAFIFFVDHVSPGRVSAKEYEYIHPSWARRAFSERVQAAWRAVFLLVAFALLSQFIIGNG